MSRAPTSNSHKQAVDRHGQAVDLYNYESDGSERVETWAQTGSSPHTIQARITPRNEPRTARDEREEGDVEIDFRVHVKADASGVASIRDGGGQGASVIDPDQDGVGSDGTDYRVLAKTDLGNGVVRLDCERMD